MHRPSLAELSDQFAETPEYAPLRTYIRGTIQMALGETRNQMKAKEMTDRECVTHSLIESWLSKEGYHIAARMLKTQLAERYVDSPEKYLENSDESIDYLLNTHLKIRVPMVDRNRELENNPPFLRGKPIKKREPIKIEAVSEEDMRKEAMELRKLERDRLFISTEKEVVVYSDSDDSSDSEENSSDDPQKSDAESPESPETPPTEKERPSFLDLDKSKTTKKPSESPEFHGNPIPKAWGPSKSGLVTDDVASDHLPSLDRPPLKSTNSEDIDALFDDDFELEGFEEESDETVKSTKPLEKREVEKPTGPGEPAEPEPVVLSGGESIDELEDFDTGLLSSGGSDYSF